MNIPWNFLGNFHADLLICMIAQYGSTAMIKAALRGDTDCVRLLAEAGADINAITHVRCILYSKKFNIKYFICVISDKFGS